MVQHSRRPTVRRLALGAALLMTATLAAPSEAYPRPGRTERISLGPGGVQSQDPTDYAIGMSEWNGAISGDGRFVAFGSTAVNLVPNDVNQASDVFVRDRATGRTEIVSVSSSGARAAGACASGRVGSFTPSITPDGRFVSFSSCATNLVPNDLNADMDGFVHDRRTHRTEMVSLSSAGKQGMTPLTPNHASFASSMSANGRYVGVVSYADNLVPNDTNAAADVFVFDRSAKTMERVSISDTEQQSSTIGGPLQASSGSAFLSDDGRYVGFSSYADNLVPNDTNATIDVFVRDRVAKKTERISVRTGGAQVGGGGTAANGGRGMSANGRFVMWTTSAANVIPNDANGAGVGSAFDVFVTDRLTRRTERISVDSLATEATDDSSSGSISADGRYVAIASTANNLAAGDTGLNGSNTTTVGAQPGDLDVFLYDRHLGIMEMLSVAPDGREARGHCGVTGEALSGDSSESFGPTVNADGQYVAFQSCANNLVKGDTNKVRDMFVRFRGPSLGLGSIYAVSGRRTDEVRGWSTFSGAAVASAADSARDGDLDAATSGAEMVGGELLYRPEKEDLLLRLNLTQIPAIGVSLSGLSGPGDPRVLYGMRFQANGVPYEVRVHRVGVNTLDPLNASYGLFECSESICNEVAKLRGGYGTTGEQVVVSIPLAAVVKNGKRLQEGGVLSALRAYTAYGSYLGGPTQVLDQLVLSTKASVAVPRRTVTLTARGVTRAATLTGGSFAASFPAGLFRNNTATVVRTCLGSVCQQRTVTLKG